MKLGLRLPDEPRAVASARRAVEGLNTRVSPERLDDVQLLVTELVTNAVRHAGGWIDVRVVALPDCIRVEVVDSGPGFDPESVADPDLDSTGGRGLFLVGQIADRWGVEREGRTRVWFEIAAN
jgi:serine/threonine-protein kinase RsbW